MKLVLDLAPCTNNPRNSEGSFIRLSDGRIMYAYSGYTGNDFSDMASCNIVAVYSSDEGESWSDPVTLIKASELGVSNVMSVSCLELENGRICIFFLVNEGDGQITIARALSDDCAKSFKPERCRIIGGPKTRYVINNDRFIKTKDGAIAAPAAMHAYSPDPLYIDLYAVSTVIVSRDGGKTFTCSRARITTPCPSSTGMQEPGLYEHTDGTLWLWARTDLGAQYQCCSRDGGVTFTTPSPSVFTSPTSPMEIARDSDGILYAVFNPVPHNEYTGGSVYNFDRTPIVVKKSTDDGKTWGPITVIEEEKNHGYCYPAMFFTDDDCMLCAYCRGGVSDKVGLARLGIMKINKSEIK